MLNQLTWESSMVAKTLKEQAALRIDLFTKSHTLYDEAMKSFNKMMNDDNKPENKGQGIYPMKLVKVSQDLFEGALAYCAAGKSLANDYRKFCKDPRFVKDYQVRVDYIDLIQEELTEAMNNLKERLKGVPFYEEGLALGEPKIASLLQKLTHTKEIMQIAILKAATPTTSSTQSNTAESATSTDKKPKKP
ncbi:MAG: hypothetical protein AB7I18_04450 [Candidatus Berkiella sp.]